MFTNVLASGPGGFDQMTQQLIQQAALPIQTLRIARERLEEARSVIRAIDAAANKESKHGDHANR